MIWGVVSQTGLSKGILGVLGPIPNCFDSEVSGHNELSRHSLLELISYV